MKVDPKIYSYYPRFLRKFTIYTYINVRVVRVLYTLTNGIRTFNPVRNFGQIHTIECKRCDSGSEYTVTEISNSGSLVGWIH